MESAATWYLMKNEDGSIFGPITFDQLHEWASDAQVSPLDKVSSDEKNWMKAPMVPELGMDYLIEVSPDQFYGPTTLGAVREFLQIGEINGDTPVTNCRDGSVVIIKDIPELQAAAPDEDAMQQPVRTSIRVNLQQRVRELEETLMDERRAREQAEHLVERLETKLNEITRAASM
ncbi:MAG: GYF domain-containing protein [Chthoniobacter sp.]|uniref:GYF domain-containing protein n=1 Tax=Chthoniobacter sp. TaxID=2510640 RepID=UPI0032AC3EFF